MKCVRSLLLAAVLSVTPCLAQAPVTPPAQAFELNAGLCGSSSLGLYHVEMDGKKIVFDYYLDKDNSVVKDTEPLVFEYTEESAIEGGAIPFKGALTLGGQEYKIVGMKYKNRVAAVVLSDGHVVYVFYGVGGPVDDLVKIQDSATQACLVFLSSDDLAAAIVRFLQGADKSVSTPASDPKVSTT